MTRHAPPLHPIQTRMPISQHRNSRQRLSPILPLPITPYYKRTIRVPLAAYAHPSRIGLQDPRLEMGLDGPGVQRLLKGFERWDFLAQVQGRHFAFVKWGRKGAQERGDDWGIEGWIERRVVGDEVGLCDVAR